MLLFSKEIAWLPGLHVMRALTFDAIWLHALSDSAQELYDHCLDPLPWWHLHSRTTATQSPLPPSAICLVIPCHPGHVLSHATNSHIGMAASFQKHEVYRSCWWMGLYSDPEKDKNWSPKRQISWSNSRYIWSFDKGQLRRNQVPGRRSQTSRRYKDASGKKRWTGTHKLKLTEMLVCMLHKLSVLFYRLCCSAAQKHLAQAISEGVWCTNCHADATVPAAPSGGGGEDNCAKRSKRCTNLSEHVLHGSS